LTGSINRLFNLTPIAGRIERLTLQINSGRSTLSGLDWRVQANARFQKPPAVETRIGDLALVEIEQLLDSLASRKARVTRYPSADENG
jgi:hypothetical protein